jgi:hypothetical protein
VLWDRACMDNVTGFWWARHWLVDGVGHFEPHLTLIGEKRPWGTRNLAETRLNVTVLCQHWLFLQPLGESVLQNGGKPHSVLYLLDILICEIHNLRSYWTQGTGEKKCSQHFSFENKDLFMGVGVSARIILTWILWKYSRVEVDGVVRALLMSISF